MPRHALFVLVLALVAAAPAAADVWEKTYPVTGRPQFVLQTDDASVHVTPWDRAAVGVRVTTHGWSIGPRGISVTARQDGARVECEVREPRFHWSFNFGARWTRIEVMLPRDADVDIATGDGSVSLGPLAGAIHVHSGDGNIRAEGVRGEMNLSTSDGHIEGTGLDGALQARSGDGGMRLEGRFDRLEASTSDGRIEATALEGSRLASGWILRSGDGSLTLRVPRTLPADLDLHSGDGSVWVGLPVETSGGFRSHTLRGRMNGGGPLLEMHTSDGRIRLEALPGSALEAAPAPPAPAPSRIAPAPPAPRATPAPRTPRAAPKPPKRAAPAPDTTGVEA